MKSYFCGQLRAMLTVFIACATPSKPFKLLTPQQLVDRLLTKLGRDYRDHTGIVINFNTYMVFRLVKYLEYPR
eukprot:937364-Pleurochrysis_carterae.AAC.1